MGFFQEYNAKKTLYALRKMIKPMAMVIREGKRKLVEAKELVTGDLIVLISGDKIPADGKLVQGEILVSEAILTGEGEGITKKEGDKVFMGTTVLSGKGIMEVEKIGKETEFGKIGKALIEIEEGKTPLQKKLEGLSKNLAILVLAICFLIFLSQILRDGKIYHAFKTAIVLAVAAIPEALPVIITVILALGMKRILKKQGLVKTLLANEVLGSTSVICLDKTGTLTEGKMRVLKFEFENKEEALKVMLLNNEERTSLEIALFNFAKENLKEDELERISKEELKEKIDKIVLFTLVLPHQKRKIVDCLQEKGEVVAILKR
jgi:Ca2+-transporting ATPase